MKRCLFLVFVPFVAFAICQECDSFRSSLLTRNQDITAEVRGMQGDFSKIVSWSASLSNSLSDSGDKGLADSIYTQAAIGQSRSAIALEMLSSNRVEILAFNCDCSSSSGCECSGVLTNMYDSLLNIEVYARETSYGMETLLHDLETFKTAVVDGFVNVSNHLDDVISSIDSVITNKYLYNFSFNDYSNTSFPYIGNSGKIYNRTTSYLTSGKYYSVSDVLNLFGRGYLSDFAIFQGSFVNFVRYPFSDFTNTVGTLTKSTTNFFSFFRGEIGVHGVLEDWTEQAGSYHDFLTNHYIQVVTGGTLSGNQSAKTNWFSRIETLLASLVFTDSESTNTVDSSSAEQQANEITSHFSEISSSASTVSHDFSEQSQDIVELYRSWCQQFDNAALPSHVVLFTLPSEGEEIVVQFSLSDTPEIVAMVEGMRAITTFCWASVGIFFLYKFLVWSARCVFVACHFVYNAISAVFK